MIERFGLAGRHEGTQWHVPPYETVDDEFVKSRGRVFGNRSSITRHVVIDGEIDVQINCSTTYGVFTFAQPKILILDNGAPSNDWFIQKLRDRLRRVFGLSAENGG